MIEFFKYRTSDGRVVLSGTCHEHELSLQKVPDGMGLSVGSAKPGQFYIDGVVSTIVTPNEQWATVRRERDLKLARTDWTQLPDVPLFTKEAWQAYRQALRDITTQADPFNITWPVAPQEAK